MKNFITIIYLLFLFLSASYSLAEIHECKTPEGKIFFSNSPCGNKIEMKEINVQKFEQKDMQENKSKSDSDRTSGNDKSYSLSDASNANSNPDNCACDSGAICAGKKGGKYCITSNGKKKYNP